MSQTLGPFDINIEFPDGTMALVATVETFVINPGPTRVVTAIHVPKAHRGQGHGRDLLRRLCTVADEHKTALYLNVTPFDNSPLDHVRLTAWYERNGFTGRNGVFRRNAQPVIIEEAVEPEPGEHQVVLEALDYRNAEDE